MKNLLLIFLLFASICLSAQGVVVSAANSLPDTSAMLDVQSTSKGFLPPRLTTAQMNAVHSPARGLMVYDTDCDVLKYWNGNGWVAAGGTGPVTAPTAGTNTCSSTQIVWNWNTVNGATGYKYNTVNDYSSAANSGTSSSFTQTGLTCNTPYTLYVWAYNTCGNSISPTSLTQITSSCCSDGTGGTITHVNGNTIHTFLTSGSFSVSNCVSPVQILVVGGGGGGGYNAGGGGGAGGYQYNAIYSVSGSYSVTVGSGGAGGQNTNRGGDGGNSVFDAITAYGGGGAGSRDGGTGQVFGDNGGSGGGGAGAEDEGNPTGGTGSQGGNGEAGVGGSSEGFAFTGGGGGGAGGSGGIATPSACGNGGDGVSNSISGSPVTYAGGGGGGSAYNNATPGTGGTGGGGNGSNSGVGGNAAPNTGGGGGGGTNVGGGNGSSGIVIISYPTP